METMQREPVAQIPAQPAPAMPVESRAQLTFTPMTTPETALLARLDAMSPTEKYALFN
jgi:hypothetical protein